MTFLTFDMSGLLGGGRVPNRSRTAAAILAFAAALGGAAAAAGPAEATFLEARSRDDLAGEIAAAGDTARVRFWAAAGSSLTFTLGTDRRSPVAVAPGQHRA